jgi:flagellin
MFSINTNNNALAALQSLDMTAQELSQTQNAVSTGQKVSSAQDNPAVYAISQTMDANIAGLSAVSDSLNLGSSVLATASAAASSIGSYLATLQQTVTQAQQTGIDPTTMQNQIDAAVTQINEFANSATFNGANILASTTTPPTGVINTSLNIVQDVNGDGLTVGNQLSGANSLAQTLGLTSAAGENLQVSASAYQAQFTSTAVPAAGDTLTLTQNDGSTDVFEFDTSGTALTTAPVANSLTTTGESNAVNVHAVMITTGESLSDILSSLVSSVNASGYTSTVDSSGNLDVMGGDLAVAGATTTAGTTSVTGMTLATGGVTNTTIDGGTAAVAVVQSAVSKMSAIQANLGSFSIQVTGMSNFTSSLSSALTSGVGALTDADLAAESAKLTSLQTKQQLAIQSLSIANAQPQALLSLFR